MTNQLTPEQQSTRFKNRRRMAWTSFVLLTLGTVVLLFFGLAFAGIAERIAALSFLIGTSFGVWASIILAYFGASAYAQGRETKAQNSPGDH